MKNIFLKILLENTNFDLAWDIWEAFRESRIENYEGWFSSGGCYEFALSLGTFFEEKGFDISYWTYGSKEEPDVHVAISIKFKDDKVYYIDFNQFTTKIKDLSDLGDYYTTTKCNWEKISKKDIPGKINIGLKKEFEDIYKKALN